MVQGHRREAWGIASAIIANSINAHAGKVVCQPDDVNPYAEKRAAPAVAAHDISAADDFFFGDDD